MECQNLKNRLMRDMNDDSDNDLQDIINRMIGMRSDGKPLTLPQIYDIIDCRLAHNLYIPEELLEKKESILENTGNIGLAAEGGSINELKNAVGSFLETICCRLDEAVKGKCKKKMFFYSTHDTTILSLLLVFGIYDGKHWPAFCANIILELYRNTYGKMFVRLLYNGNPVILETNEEYLPVERFRELVDVYRVLDWAEDCGNESLS